MKKSIRVLSILLALIMIASPVSFAIESGLSRQSEVKLDKEIEFLKEVYEVAMERDSNGNMGGAGLSKQATGASRLAGLNVKDIQDSIYIDDKSESAFQLAQSILTLIGADINPRNYNHKGKNRNLVKELEELQMETGEFASTEREKLNFLFQLRSIIALDLADGDYDEEKAVSKLLELYEKRDNNEIINYKAIETEGLMLLALSNHKDKKGVNQVIDQVLEFLKEKQNDEAGFNMRSGVVKGTNSPLAIGRVIQGLIANGINPLKDKDWIKGNKTMLDAIVKSKIVKENMKHSGYSKGEEDDYAYEGSTSVTFGALMDLKNQKSMFHILSLNEDVDQNDIDISHKALDDTGKVEIKVNGPKNSPMTITIYDSHRYYYMDQGKTDFEGEIKFVMDLDLEQEYTVKVNMDSKLKEYKFIMKEETEKPIDKTFKLRIEANDKTLLEPVDVKIDDLDLTEYGISTNFDEVKPIHVIIKGLEEHTNINPKDQDQFKHGGGNFITKVGDYERNGLNKDLDGWMYYVNHKFANRGVEDFSIEEGDYIVLYFQENWKDITYSWFEKEELSVNSGQDISVQLKGNRYDMMNKESIDLDVEGATILINNEPQEIKTDKNGKAKFKLDTPGVYHISAERYGKNSEIGKYRNISRPYLKLNVDKASLEKSKSNLEEKISEVEKIDFNKYTDESVRELKSILRKLNIALSNEFVNQKEIESYLLELDEGIKSMTLKPSSGSTGGGSVSVTSPEKPEEKLEEKPGDKKEETEVKTEDGELKTKFKDVKNHWAKDTINKVVEKGYFKGTSKDTFSPDRSITRAEFVTVLGRGLETDMSRNANSSFADIKKDAYYVEYANWATEKGIVKGYGDGTFRPEKEITREEMAVMLARYLEVIEEDRPSINEVKFVDSKEMSNWAKDSIYKITKMGLIKGKPNNRFAPKDKLTRAETAQILINLNK